MGVEKRTCGGSYCVVLFLGGGFLVGCEFFFRGLGGVVARGKGKRVPSWTHRIRRGEPQVEHEHPALVGRPWLPLQRADPRQHVVLVGGARIDAWWRGLQQLAQLRL